MHSTIIGLASGIAWMTASFLIEDWFPMGDWRWAIGTIIALLVAVAVHLHGRRRAMKTTNNSANGWNVACQMMKAYTPKRAKKLSLDFKGRPNRNKDDDIFVDVAPIARRRRDAEKAVKGGGNKRARGGPRKRGRIGDTGAQA